MQRPTWATVVGIIGILFACCGILGGTQLVMAPKILEFQKTMMGTMEQTMELAEKQAARRVAERAVPPDAPVPVAPVPVAPTVPATAVRAAPLTAVPPAPASAAPAVPAPARPLPSAMPSHFFKMFAKFTETPPWFPTWCMIGGLTAVAISIAYLIGSVGLLLLKQWGPRLFLVAAVADIVFVLVRAGVQASMSSIMALGAIPGAVLALAIGVTLFVVALMGDKQAFRPAPMPADWAEADQARPQ